MNRGCVQCNHTGYRGRIAIHEIITVDSMLRRMISSQASMEEIVEYAKENQNIRTLRDSALQMVREGISTPEEMLKVAYE